MFVANSAVLNLEHSTITLIGLGSTTIKPLDFFSTDIIEFSSYKINVYAVTDYSVFFNFIIDTDVIQQNILTISESIFLTQKILKNKNISDNFLINVTQVLDGSILIYLILLKKPYVDKFHTSFKIILFEK